jgi:hypothetical protein
LRCFIDSAISSCRRRHATPLDIITDAAIDFSDYFHATPLLLLFATFQHFIFFADISSAAFISAISSITPFRRHFRQSDYCHFR